MTPPPRPRGSGFGGVFVVLAIVGVVLAGTISFSRGAAFGLSLLSGLDQSGSQGGPVAARPVSGPLSTQDAVALQRLVGPALVDVTAELTSQHAVGAGTGIVLSSNGEILTNNHVIRGASSIKVTDIGNGRTYPATVVGYDPARDIAVLAARGASGLRTAKLGDSDNVQIGDQVAAIGNAGGIGGRPSVATGPVTDLDRTIKTSDALDSSTERLSGLIEANADIQPGDSGGPMVNTEGEVVGVDVAASVDSRSQTPNGTGFAIPINDAMAVVRQIRGGSSTEAVHIGETGLLGVTVTELSDRTMRDAMAELGTSPSGVPSVTGAFVAVVAFDSPAEQVGLVSGDVITGVNGVPVGSATALTTLIGMHRPGDQLLVAWTEPSGQQRSGTVALAAGPPS
jgi:S1-C subfamily serine protease